MVATEVVKVEPALFSMVLSKVTAPAVHERVPLFSMFISNSFGPVIVKLWPEGRMSFPVPFILVSSSVPSTRVSEADSLTVTSPAFISIDLSVTPDEISG